MANSAFKIDSPYAKAGFGGQLTCTLCNAPVKSAKVWIAHVNGRQHRENLAARNQNKSQTQKPSQKPALTKAENVSFKRPAPVEKSNGQGASDAVKKAKTIAADRGPQQASATVGNQNASASASARPLVQTAVNYDDSESESDSDAQEDTKPAVTSTGLPADFFDAGTSSVVKAKTESNEMDTSESPMPADSARQKSGELPEGFFDDRKKDAKVRGVELKDPLDEEWSKFQKEIQKVEVVSEQIIEEDEDEMTLTRELDEADEQLREWTRINELEKRKEALAIPESKDSERNETDEASSKEPTDDEADDVSLEHVLDWRSKDVWK